MSFQLPPPDRAPTASFPSSASGVLLPVTVFQLLQARSIHSSDEISANQGTNAVGGPALCSCSGMPTQAAGRALNHCSVNYLIIKRVLILLLMSPEGFSVNFTPSLGFEHILSPPPPLFSLAFFLFFLLSNLTQVPFLPANAGPGGGSTSQSPAVTSCSFPAVLCIFPATGHEFHHPSTQTWLWGPKSHPGGPGCLPRQLS